MSTTLATLRTLVSNYLSDVSNTRFSTAIIDIAIEQALTEYSLSVPNIQTIVHTVTEAVKDQPLDGLSGSSLGFNNIIDVYFPYASTNTDQPRINNYQWFHTSGSPTLRMIDYTPTVAQEIQIRYMAMHTITDLNSAAATTPREDHIDTIAYGAAAHAATIRAAAIAEAFTSRSTDYTNLKTWGSQALNIFRNRLNVFRINNISATGPLPPSGWELDQWS